MFDLLKKKLSSFVSGITKKHEEAPAAEAPAAQAPAVKSPVIERQDEPQDEKQEARSLPSEQEIKQERGPSVEEPIKEPATNAASTEPVFTEPIKPEECGEEIAPTPAFEPTARPRPAVQQTVPVEKPLRKQEVTQPEERRVFVEPVAEPALTPEARQPVAEPIEAEKKQRNLAPKLGIFTKIKSVFTSEVTITEAETNALFDELEMALLESDVSFDTAQFLVSDLRKKLVGRKVPKSQIGEVVKQEIASTLEAILSSAPRIDLERKISDTRSQGRPFVMMFVGPNGAGKTTTIAKVAFRLKQKGISSVISASDTFRAAAVEQAVHHGEKLGIRVIKHGYGADPAAVAFDAIAHAKANKLDVVLIDTAGRQETNVNLVKEMEKINRVIAPDLKVFVGEAIAGNALVEQVKKFNEVIGLNGLVLTKLDADAKGGNSLSIAFEAKLPVLFIGMGQAYEDLIEFEPKQIIGKVLEA